MHYSAQPATMQLQQPNIYQQQTYHPNYSQQPQYNPQQFQQQQQQQPNLHTPPMNQSIMQPSQPPPTSHLHNQQSNTMMRTFQQTNQMQQTQNPYNQQTPLQTTQPQHQNSATIYSQPQLAALSTKVSANVHHPTFLKQVDRASKVAWCPSPLFPDLIASGTSAGTIDDTFESKSQLEVYDIDLRDKSYDMKCIGSISVKDCFHSIAWGLKGIDDKSFASGLLAGGMSDGSINLWSVQSIVGHYPVKNQNSVADALLSHSEHHKGQVLSLQFHPGQPNLLCSGATDGEVFIWDLAAPRQPKPSKPNPVAKPQTTAQHNNAVTSVAWNKKSFQILATSDSLGDTTIWDLRQKRSIVTLHNSSRIQVRTSGISWSPETATQIAVVYANTSIGEIWDLRQSMQPRQRLDGYHTGSLLAVDWCVHDSSLLLTSGEDGKVAAWNTTTGQFSCDYQSAGVTFDLQFSPSQPNLYSSCTYEGKVSIHSISSTGDSMVPKWMMKGRGVGSDFGFGGKLVSFTLPTVAQAPPSVPSTPRSIASLNLNSNTKQSGHPVHVQSIVTDPQVLGLAQQFQSVIETGSFIAFCNNKISSAQTEDEKVVWTFMRILFEDERNQRFLLLKELGFEAPANSETARQLNEAAVASVRNSQPVSPAAPEMTEEEFFNQDFSSPVPEQPAALESQFSKSVSLAGKASGPIDTYRALSATDEDEAAIRDALIFGDFACAVERCLSTNRIADALIFSSFGPPALWESTKAAYFAQHKHPFVKNVMKAVSQQSLHELVATSQLSQWKETLAILMTYTSGNKFRELVNQLGERLEHEHQLSSAILCYMCSSNVDKSLSIWSRTELRSNQPHMTPTLALHTAIEKITILAQATRGQLASHPSALLSVKYTEYASMLACQGFFNGAWNYLKTASAGAQFDMESAVLLDRIYHAALVSEPIQAQPPAFPFQIENVGIDPNSAVTQQQIAAKKQELASRAQVRAPAHAPIQQPAQVQNPYAPQTAQANPYSQQSPYQTAQQYSQPGGRLSNTSTGSFGAPQTPAAFGATQQPAAVNSYQPTNPYPAQARPPTAGPAFQPQPQGFGVPQSFGVQRNSFASPVAQTFQSQTTMNYGGGQTQFQSPVQQPPPIDGPTGVIFNPMSVSNSNPNGSPGPLPQIFNPAATGPIGPTGSTGPTGPIGLGQVGPMGQSAPAPPQKVAQPLTGEQQASYNILEQCCQALASIQAGAAERKKVADVQQRLQLLHQKLSYGELSPSALAELTLLCQCVARQAYTEAQKHHMQLVKNDWTSNGDWLLGLKTMLQLARKYLGGT